MNNTSYLLKTKNRWQLKINKTQKLSDLINTALTSFAFLINLTLMNEVSVKWFMLRNDRTLSIDSKIHQF